jgi:hypothetical protein
MTRWKHILRLPPYEIEFVYATIQQLAAGVNPVRKVLLVVMGHESEVCIDPLFGDSDNDEQARAIFRPGNCTRSWVSAEA